MDAQLAHLLDESAIRQLLARYSRAIDRRDYDLLRSCYHPDAVDEHGVYDGDVDGFIAYLRAHQSAAYESHFLGNHSIELDGSGAFAETYCLALRRFTDRAGVVRDRVQHVRYLDRLERRDGEWRIAHRVVSYGHGRIVEVEEPTGFVDSAQRDRRDRADPVYRLRDGTPPVA
jgi:ketosteroid isomerase-like protein